MTRELSQDEVLEILQAIESSSFDQFELTVGSLRIALSRGQRSLSAPAAAPAAVPPTTPPAEPPRHAPSAHPAAEASPADGTVSVASPLAGIFYVAPEPQAPPFVQLGARVEEDTTVGLIEVMKVFTAVKAGVRGTIAAVCAENGQLVEFGQRLFRVRQEGAVSDGAGRADEAGAAAGGFQDEADAQSMKDGDREGPRPGSPKRRGSHAGDDT